MSSGITIDAPDLRKVARQIRAANPEAAKELRRAFRRIGNEVLPDTRSNALGILPSRLAGPAARSLKLSVDNDRVGISVRNAGPGGKGQIARVFEIGSRRDRGWVRHPLFGMRDKSNHWYQFRIRPFIQPAIAARREWAGQQLQEAITTAMRKAGIWGSVKFDA